MSVMTTSTTYGLVDNKSSVIDCRIAELAIVDPVGRKALVTQFNNGRERELAGHGNLSAAFCKALP